MLIDAMISSSKLLLVACGLVALSAWPTIATERVDFFDTEGRRTGYAIVDSKTGRVDFYDVMSRRTGWGRLEPSGRVEWVDLNGRRQSETAIPLGTKER